MPSTLGSRLRHAWNAFLNKDPTPEYVPPSGTLSYRRPDRIRYTRGNERTIITPIYNRIAMDVAAITVNHVQLDKNGRFSSVKDSSLNECLTIDANVDQTGRALMQDIVASMLDEGCVAVVPTDTSVSIRTNTSFDIYSLRTGKIEAWYPYDIRVRVYNERIGRHETITVPKRAVAIVENPFYSVMNEDSSTLKRLLRKLQLLDIVDEQNSSAKLDLIIQLPYVIKTEKRRAEAEERRKMIENQLAESQYGIAYTDGTERITQLNRPLENNLLKQVEYLTNLLYSQLGISQAVMDGTADEKEMLNYNNRTIEPIISAVTDEMKRKFLTKTARTQGQSIMFFKDPFRLVPVNDIAEIADKFTRNEIATSNEIRQVIGWKPSDDPRADELRNANISDAKQTTEDIVVKEQNQEVESQNGKTEEL